MNMKKVMKKVNMCIGRFQPFTKGHLQMVKDGYDKNGLPCVICMIQNKKLDSKHPFPDELLQKEMDILKKNYPFIETTIYVNAADIVKAGQKMHDMGYEAQLWLCGDDRMEPYKKQAENPKYQEQGFYPSTFTVYTGTGRTEGVSGTAVRNSLKDDDIEKFRSLTPKGVDKLFDEFKDALFEIVEDYRISLYDYICEDLTDEQYNFKKWNIKKIREEIKEIIPDIDDKKISSKRLRNKKKTGFEGMYYELLIGPLTKSDKVESKLDEVLNPYGLVSVEDNKYYKYEKHLIKL